MHRPSVDGSHRLVAACLVAKEMQWIAPITEIIHEWKLIHPVDFTLWGFFLPVDILISIIDVICLDLIEKKRKYIKYL